LSRTNYVKRLKLPLEGSDDVSFFTKCGTLVARGYARVVVGDRGPYVEFEPQHIVAESFHIPKDQEYRKADKRVYYVEARSNDAAYVKLYFQRKTVEYADYLVGRFYISPFELTSDKYPVLIEPLRSKEDEEGG